MLTDSEKNGTQPAARFSPQEVMAAGLTIITAHSGCENTAPNSLDHIRSAIASGAEMVEFDVREEDGRLILSHDLPKPDTARVTLDEALRLLQPYSQIEINCDVKTRNLMPAVMELAAQYGMTKRIVFTGEANGELAEARSLGGDMWHSLFGAESPEEVEAAFAECRATGCVSLNLYFKMANSSLHHRLQSVGMGLSVWTVNKEEDLRQMLELGVMNITTEQPRLAMRLREEIQGTPAHPKKFPVQPICRAMQEAGRMLRCADEAAVERGTQHKEGCGNLVTSFDKSIQRYLKDSLKRLFPEAAFYAEEQDGEGRRVGALTVYIDPIDGTANFVHGNRCSAVSVAVCKKNTPVFGAVYLPYADEMFFAEKGLGAYLNGRPIHVSRRNAADALAIVGTASYEKETLGKTTMALTSALFFHMADIRRYGSAAMELCYVACGRAELSFEARLHPWDYAAGALLVEEAGGRVSDLSGTPVSYEQAGSLLCANQEVYSQALRICRECLAKEPTAATAQFR